MKGLSFVVSLRDALSKPVSFVIKSLDLMRRAMGKTGLETKNLQKSFDLAVKEMNKRKRALENAAEGDEKKLKDLKTAFAESQKKVRLFADELAEAREKDEEMEKALGESEVAAKEFYGSLDLLADGLGSSMQSVMSFSGALNKLKEIADEVQETLINLYRRIDLSVQSWAKLRKEFDKSALSMEASGENIANAFDQISIVQMRGKGISKFIESIHKLSSVTEISKDEAGQAMRTFDLWYKGGKVGMIGLANAIRYVSTNTKLSAQEATNLLQSFVEIAKVLPKEMRSKVAPQALALGAYFREIEAPVQELESMFGNLTNLYNIEGQKLRMFLSRQTNVTIEEIDRMIQGAEFTKILDLLAESVSEVKLPREQFLMFRQTMQEVTGVSWDTARAFREMTKEQRAAMTKNSAEIIAAAERNKELDESYKEVRSTFKAVADQILNLAAPAFREIGEIMRKDFVMVAQDYVIPALKSISAWVASIPAPVKKAIAVFLQIAAVVTVITTGVVALWALKAVFVALTPLLVKLAVLFGALLLAGIALYGAYKLVLYLWTNYRKEITLLSTISYKFLYAILYPMYKVFVLLGKLLWSVILPPLKILKVLFDAFLFLSKHFLGHFKYFSDLFDRGSFSDFLEDINHGLAILIKYVEELTDSLDGLTDSFESLYIPVEKLFSKDPTGFWKKMGEFTTNKAKVGIADIAKQILPGAAEGGIVTKQTQITVGEGNKPEAIIPLNRIGEVMKNTISPAEQEKIVRADPRVTVNIDTSKMLDTLQEILTELRNASYRTMWKDGISLDLASWRT